MTIYEQFIEHLKNEEKKLDLLNQTQYCQKEINANNFSKLLRGVKQRRGYYNCQLIRIALDKKNVR